MLLVIGFMTQMVINNLMVETRYTTTFIKCVHGVTDSERGEQPAQAQRFLNNFASSPPRTGVLCNALDSVHFSGDCTDVSVLDDLPTRQTNCFVLVVATHFDLGARRCGP